MKVLKGFGLGILSFLLFISLSVFGASFMLNNTVLNPDFVVSELDKLDISSLVKEVVSEQVPQDMDFVVEALDDIITDLEPWIREQMNVMTYAGYDYLMGRSESLSMIIHLEPVKESLRDKLKEAILQSPPPELAGIPPAMIEQNFDLIYQQITGQIPSTFEIDESLFPPEVQTTLEQVRQGIGYYQTGYWGLIGFILLLILGIVLIHHEVRGAARGLGITFLCYGVIEYAGIRASKYFAMPYLHFLEIPAAVQSWIPQVIVDVLARLEIYSLGFLAGGIVLLVISFVYRRE